MNYVILFKGEDCVPFKYFYASMKEVSLWATPGSRSFSLMRLRCMKGKQNNAVFIVDKMCGVLYSIIPLLLRTWLNVAFNGSYEAVSFSFT